MDSLFGDWVNNIKELSNEYITIKPYPYIIIPNFLNESFINNIYNEYLQISDNLSDWHINKTLHKQVDYFIKIRPLRRIEQHDILQIWPDWNSEKY